jgi:hypothetical protein
LSPPIRITVDLDIVKILRSVVDMCAAEHQLGSIETAKNEVTAGGECPDGALHVTATAAARHSDTKRSSVPAPARLTIE